MNAVTTPRTTLQSLNAALAEIAQGTTTAADLKPRFQAAQKDLEGYEVHTKAIDFDRPDKDVSDHGRALRAQADGAWAEVNVAHQDLVSITGNAERIQQHMKDALAACPPNKPKAKQYIESAQTDIDRLQKRTLRDATVTTRLTEKALRTEVSPYLTEVEEDAPGRDVGRHADNIHHWLSEGVTGSRMGALSGGWIDTDLKEIQRRLEWAKNNL